MLSVITPVSAQSSNQVTIQNDARLARIRDLIERTGVLPNDGKTLFLPTGEGLDKFQQDYADFFQKYNNQPEFSPHLKQLISWHFVTEGAFAFDQIFDGSRTAIRNNAGNITIEQRTQTLDGTPATAIIERDIQTTQGYIHIMDQLIIPPFMGFNLIQGLLDTVNGQFAYSTMANLALYAQLDDRLNSVYENGLTLLVPPNIRFTRAEMDIPSLLTPEMFNFTRDFVLAHMIDKNWHEKAVYDYHNELREDQHLVISGLGTHMWVTTTERKLRFQSIDVLLPDQPSNYGYVHG
jgi:uncharacterized surface protein with fasciclin (FAS1) repeats